MSAIEALKILIDDYEVWLNGGKSYYNWEGFACS